MHIVIQKTKIKQDSLWSWEGKVVLHPGEMECNKDNSSTAVQDT